MHRHNRWSLRCFYCLITLLPEQWGISTLFKVNLYEISTPNIGLVESLGYRSCSSISICHSHFRQSILAKYKYNLSLCQCAHVGLSVCRRFETTCSMTTVDAICDDLLGNKYSAPMAFHITELPDDAKRNYTTWYREPIIAPATEILP